MLDKLGGGYVTTAIDKADTHAPYMTDLIRAGIAHHEFAHVLQFTNPAPSDLAAKSFGGNHETMADCFALTYLKGWKLHYTVFIDDFQHYEVDVGYGYTTKQRGVIRDWYEVLDYELPPITQ